METASKSEQWQSYKLRTDEGHAELVPQVFITRLSRRHFLDGPASLHVFALQKWASKSFKWALDRCQQSFRERQICPRHLILSLKKYRRKRVGADREEDRDGWTERRKGEVHVEWIPLNTFSFSFFFGLFCLFLFSLPACAEGLWI